MTDKISDYKLIRAGLLIDGRGGLPVPRGAILINGSVICSVGAQEEIILPEDTPVDFIDYPDKTVMPGMVDCHTHHNGFGDGRSGDDLARLPDEVLTLQSARNARAALFSGVTSVRENGPKNDTMFRLRESIRDGISVGPRMVLCGRPVSIIGGHMGYFGSEVTGPEEARAMTRQLVKEGADYIKITATGGSTRSSFPLRPSFNVVELEAIVSEAHKFGLLTASHCVSSQGIVNSLDAGVDMIIHSVFKDADGTDNFRKDIADRIGEQGAYVNPTLHVYRAKTWAVSNSRVRRGQTADYQSYIEKDLREFNTRLEHCSRLIEMGLKVITGSDSSWEDYRLGNTVYEVECLVMAGYSPMQAVLSVTSEAAVALGIDDVTGTLESGKSADIIVVDGNPADNVNDLWNIVDVYFGGCRIDRGSEHSLQSIRQIPIEL